MTSKGTNAAGLTAREVDILCAMCQSLKSKPETDMKKFATLAGFTTPASATTNLSKVLKKVMGKDSASPESTKKTNGRKRKAAAGDSAEDDDVEDTPSKKKGKKSKHTKKDDVDGDADGDGDGDDGDTKVKDEVSDDAVGDSV
ncbi:hypothetical protein E2P81_ATG10289 [Venturia nashicola]|nr:hypothetical protein E2P81_ATG10289 [Venturia nashicola]